MRTPAPLSMEPLAGCVKSCSHFLGPKSWNNSLCLQTSRFFFFGNKLLILLLLSIIQDSLFIFEGIFMFMPINLPLFCVFSSSFIHMTYDHLSYEASVMKFNPPTLAFNVAFYQIADSNCC